jgi:serine/threonine-protein kinase RsbT
MAISRQIKVDINVDDDVAMARETCRRLLQETGFGEHQQVKFTTAVSELARNVIKYADHGVCIFDTYLDRHKCRVAMVIEDKGPGIKDIDKALQAGFSTSGTLGVGLSGVKNLVDEFKISSSPKGTRIAISIKGRVNR